MQPYFFPYLGYFSLIKHTDDFILFDVVQFIRHGWIERNRVLKPDVGWQYISVPLEKFHRSTLIKDIVINNKTDWKDKIVRQLEHYKKRAPFYLQTIDVVREAFSREVASITLLNGYILKSVCSYLSIPFEIKIFSEMNLSIDSVTASDEWALNICKATNGVDEYWNTPGGKEFFNREKYEAQNIKLCFQDVQLLPYRQKTNREELFEAGLSIIDVMMFNSPESIQEMLDNYKLS